MPISSVNKHKRSHQKWLAKGPTGKTVLLQEAIDLCVGYFEAQGFNWVSQSFDGDRVRSFEILMERPTSRKVEQIEFGFDPGWNMAFWVSFRVKDSSPPHQMTLCKDLAHFRKFDIEPTRWGPRWWNIRRDFVFRRDANKVATFLPEIIACLEDGKIGKHII
ncbi:MAG: hypothetical protein AAFQ84_08445 [Pseudomonadota bacterium]